MTFKFFSVLLSLLLLSGCATPQTPEPLIELKEVKVLVEVKCKVSPIKKPELVLDNVKPGIAVDDLLMAYALDEVSLRQYSDDLRVALINCVSNPEVIQ